MDGADIWAILFGNAMRTEKNVVVATGTLLNIWFYLLKNRPVKHVTREGTLPNSVKSLFCHRLLKLNHKEYMKTFGWIATGFSLVYKIPQIYVTLTSKQVTGLSFFSLCFQSLSYIFYVVHGVMIDDMPIIVMGSISMLQSLLLVILYIHFSRKNITET